MTKIYPKGKSITVEAQPKKETINFLLNYSKSLHPTRTKIGVFDIILN
jgi:hypothetical protein